MGFMTSYKRLDNLCKDMNGIGVTGYIEDMEKLYNGSYLVAYWKEDYSKLKHYRHIRNQISHENYAEEDNMCSVEDTEWIENFYRRLLNQSDPIMLYKEATKPKPKPVNTKSENYEIRKTSENPVHTPAPYNDYSYFDILKHFLPVLIPLAIIVVISILIIIFFF